MLTIHSSLTVTTDRTRLSLGTVLLRTESSIFRSAMEDSFWPSRREWLTQHLEAGRLPPICSSRPGPVLRRSTIAAIAILLLPATWHRARWTRSGISTPRRCAQSSTAAPEAALRLVSSGIRVHLPCPAWVHHSTRKPEWPFAMLSTDRPLIV